MTRARDPLDVLSKHQFPDNGEGGCTARDGWGLAVGGGTDNEQMAEHQMQMLDEAGFKVVRK